MMRGDARACQRHLEDIFEVHSAMNLPPHIDRLTMLNCNQHGDLNCHLLGEGDHNHVWRIRQGQQDIVIRLPKGEPHGENYYRAEIYNQTCAHQLGLAPKALAEDVRSGLLVSEFVGERCVKRSDFECNQFRRELVRALRRLHDSGHWFLYQHDFLKSVAKKTAKYLQTDFGSFPSTFYKMSLIAERVRIFLLAQPLVLCPIHADLALKNMMLTEAGLRFIDWEVSGMGDRFEEVAFVLFNSDMSPEQAVKFLDLYLSETSCDEPPQVQAANKTKTILYWLLHIYSWVVEHDLRAAESDDPSYDYQCCHERLVEFNDLITSGVASDAFKVVRLATTG
jgi:thiamine kinase-like enzyme